MLRKLKLMSVLLAFTVLVIVASSATAQRPAPTEKAPPTLPCCRCLGGTSTLDLSTIASNPWTVNGNPAVFLSAIHPYWNINPGPAKWVSTTAGGGTSDVAAGSYAYELKFVVPKCTIEQRVSLTGNFGGDDDISIFLDNTPLFQGTGGWWFNIPHHPSAPTFSTLVGSGAHTLLVNVQNGGGPTGMFVNAKLVSTCRD